MAPRIFGRSLVITLITLASMAMQFTDTVAWAQEPSMSHRIGDYSCRSIQNLSVTIDKGPYNSQAGKKVNSEFGMVYKLAGSGTMRYKAPNQIRIDGKIVGLHGTFIMDGMIQRIRVGTIHKNLDQSQSPGRVSSLLDLGLVSDYYVSYTIATYVGIHSINGVPCAEFRLIYPKQFHDTSSRLVWIDPKTRITLRREEYGQDGALHVAFNYLDPSQISPGVWMPSRIDAFNSDGELVGELKLNHITANQGLHDSLFH